MISCWRQLCVGLGWVWCVSFDLASASDLDSSSLITVDVDEDAGVDAKNKNQDKHSKDEWTKWTCDELTPDLCSDVLTVETGMIPIPSRPGIQVKYWRYSTRSRASQTNEETSKIQQVDSDQDTSDSENSEQDPLISDSYAYPIVALHGGPGWPHNYMLPLKQQACRGRDIIFYDQAGCGKSSLSLADSQNIASGSEEFSFLLDPKYYSEEELPAVVSYLHLNDESKGYHLLGHSWGSILAQLFVLNSNQTTGLQSVILSGPLSDSQSYIEAQWDEKEGNIGSMIPPFVKERIRKLAVDKQYDSAEYQAIAGTLTSFFTCRTEPPPQCLADSFSGENTDIYVGMQGASEFAISGTLGDFNVTARLHEIDVPVLLTSGRFDTMRPIIVETMHQKIKFSERVIFQKSGHVSMIDEPGEMNQVVHDFLTRVEAPPVAVVLIEDNKGVFVTKPLNGSLREVGTQEFEDASVPLQNNDGNASTTTTIIVTWREVVSTLVVAIVVSFLVGMAVGHYCLPAEKSLRRNHSGNGYTQIS